MPTLFETINQRADAIKAARWQAYIPLTAQQLTDYDSVADEPVIEPEPLPEGFTILLATDDPRPPVRSTRRSAHKYKQFVVLKRPTERMAVAHANGSLMLDGDYPQVVSKRLKQKRWCIYCQDRHPLSAFVRHKRYACGISYACKTAIQERKRLGWYYASLKERGIGLTAFV